MFSSYACKSKVTPRRWFTYLKTYLLTYLTFILPGGLLEINYALLLQARHGRNGSINMTIHTWRRKHRLGAMKICQVWLCEPFKKKKKQLMTPHQTGGQDLNLAQIWKQRLSKFFFLHQPGFFRCACSATASVTSAHARYHEPRDTRANICGTQASLGGKALMRSVLTSTAAAGEEGEKKKWKTHVALR